MNTTTHPVLVVENDANTATNLTDCLKQWGYDALEPVSTVEQAVSRARDLQPHLILMDILLDERYPDTETGVAAAEQIRRNGGVMPIVFITAYTAGYLEKASKVGFFAFIEKPINEIILKECVRCAIEHYEFQRTLVADESLKVVGRMATGLIHTLKSVLTPLYLGIERLRSESARLGGTASAKFLGRVDESLKHGKWLLEQTCLLAGPSTSQLVVFDGRELAGWLLDLGKGVAPIGIVLQEIHSPDEPQYISGNLVALEVAFADLLLNAFEAMPQGGTLNIGVAACSLDDIQAKELDPSMQAGNYVVFTISDTGKGITAEALGTLFDRGISNHSDIRGRGLGLWFVKEVVRSNNGYLPLPVARSGGGTVFRIYFKAADAGLDTEAPPFSKQTLRETSLGRGRLILYAEDDPTTYSIVVAHLLASGFQVIPVRAAGQARSLAETNADRIDAIVTDVHLPEAMDVHWIRDLRKKAPRAKLIVCSGTVGPEVTADTHDAFLAKPFLMSELLDLLRALLP